MLRRADQNSQLKQANCSSPKRGKTRVTKSQCCSVAFDVWWGGTEFPFRITEHRHLFFRFNPEYFRHSNIKNFAPMLLNQLLLSGWNFCWFVPSGIFKSTLIRRKLRELLRITCDLTSLIKQMLFPAKNNVIVSDKLTLFGKALQIFSQVSVNRKGFDLVSKPEA